MKAECVRRVRKKDDQLEMEVGEIITLVDTTGDLWIGRSASGTVGSFPKRSVRVIDPRDDTAESHRLMRRQTELELNKSKKKRLSQ
jgi:hypothetical protein